MPQSFDIVVACDANRGIGKNNSLPWKLPGDMKYFKELTCATTGSGARNAVVMGRNTWESIPPKFRPLPGRLNIVLTSSGSYELPDGVYLAHSLDEALTVAEAQRAENIFVIGGGKVYEQALSHARCRRLYVTEIASVFDCDVFLPPIEKLFAATQSKQGGCDNDVAYSFKVYEKKPLATCS
jgi:dihydrofolate reductase/thymidylate synthase